MNTCQHTTLFKIAPTAYVNEKYMLVRADDEGWYLMFHDGEFIDRSTQLTVLCESHNIELEE